MMAKIVGILIILNLLNFAYCLVTVVFYDEIKDCSSEINAKGGLLNLSYFEIISTDDTHTYLNGSLKFNVEIKSPWKGRIFSEKYDRGQWILDVLDRNINDVCGKLQDPMSPLYPYFYDQPKCPMKSGTLWKYNMRQMMIPRRVPAEFRGEWQVTLISEGKINGITEKQCLRFRYDIFEYSN